MKKHVVTGAYSYSGSYLARRLLEDGREVVTLTNKPATADPFNGRVKAFPLKFERNHLVSVLNGAEVLYNTYWVRFDHTSFTHQMAVENTKLLFKAAAEAGVKRIVHVSITNPDIHSDLPYFRGKAELEEALENSGIPYTILRPTVLFGLEDILINNIAWMIRKFPLFGVFGDGKYELQPIYVDDLAMLAQQAGCSNGNEIIDATGPERFTYIDMVHEIMAAIGIRRPVIRLNPGVAWWMGKLISNLKHDITITREEIQGLMEGRLATDAPPAGNTKLSEWMRTHKDQLGATYHNELTRRG